MALKLVVLKDSKKNETRTAATPEIVKKYVSLGVHVEVEKGLGVAAGFLDADYKKNGAAIVSSAMAGKNADLVLSVNAPSSQKTKQLKKGAVLLAMLDPHNSKKNIELYATTHIQAMAMELMPRITRAQSMDVLSSQSNLAGYKSVLDAAHEYGRAYPMMMTAAGTIAPAKIFVMGAGVAGLQAIATARRLGAIVSATDVRAAAAEQVESLGASFVMVAQDADESGETAAGYAKEMSEDYKKRQAELVSEHIAKQDIVICTALIPGRQAPVLVSKKQVESMRPGSVIVDLAVEQGGNCVLSKAGEVISHKNVKIVGHTNVPGRLAGNASELYARNLYNFISTFFDKESQLLNLDAKDEIIAGITLTRNGAIVHRAIF